MDWLESVLPFPVHRTSAGNILQDMLNHTKNKSFASMPYFTESTKGREGRLRRQCTKEYKLIPIYKKIRELAGLLPGERAAGKVFIHQLIGISMDEAVRMKPSGKAWVENLYPLIDKGMSRNDCLKWITSRGYPMPQKSSCLGCPYHSDAGWREIKKNNPRGWRQVVMLDRMIRNGVRGTKQKVYLHRSLKPIEEYDFRSVEEMGQGVLFDNFGEECEGMCGV